MAQGNRQIEATVAIRPHQIAPENAIRTYIPDSDYTHLPQREKMDEADSNDIFLEENLHRGEKHPFVHFQSAQTI